MPEYNVDMLLDRSSFPARITLPDIVGYTNEVFALKINPHWREVEAQSYAWFDSYGIFSGAKRHKFLEFGLALYTGRVYPDADVDRLRVATDFMLWLFALDDIIDRTEEEPCNRVSAAEMAINANMNVLRSPESPPPELRIAASLHSCFNRMRTNASPTTIQRLVDAIRFYTQSVLQETLNQSYEVAPTVDQFIQLRRDTCAARLIFIVLEYAHNIVLPIEVQGDPIIAELVECCNDIIGWVNDIYSCPLELAHGDTHNLVFIAMRDKHLNLEEGVDYVDKLVRARLKQYEDAKARLQSFGPELDNQIALYIQGLESSVMGTIHWVFETPRYFGKHVTNVRETGLVDIVLPTKDVPMFLKE